MTEQMLHPLSRLTLAVFRAQQALSTEGDRLTAKRKLTSAKWKVLGALFLAGEPLSAAAIGRAMGLSRQAAIKQVRLLLDQGLLQQQADPRDARAPVHRLTSKGQTAYAAISADWAKRIETLAAGITERELDGATAVLDALLARLERDSGSARRRP